mmetsp:Transcript_26915/g.59566  ORF Transcript_26915/g.59566 Transcript_26915/m.59566 type:complete len:121 (+) Transcript_26915:105-467(+)
MVGEMFVLLMRVLLPIHVICSVLQATNLSKVLMGEREMGLFRLLLPAVFLHGCFDFVLFLMGAAQYAYEVDSVMFDVFSNALPAAITVVGVVVAYRGFTQVQASFDSAWQAFPPSAHEML